MRENADQLKSVSVHDKSNKSAEGGIFLECGCILFPDMCVLWPVSVRVKLQRPEEHDTSWDTTWIKTNLLHTLAWGFMSGEERKD